MIEREKIQEIPENVPVCVMPQYRQICELLRHQQISPTVLTDARAAASQIRSLADELKRRNDEIAALREMVRMERQRFQDLFAAAPCGYVETDIHGTIRTANHVSAVLLNLAQAELVGKPLPIFVIEESQPALESAFDQLRHTRYLPELELHLRPLNGESFDAVLTAMAFCDRAGDPITVNWLFQDVQMLRSSGNHFFSSIQI